MLVSIRRGSPGRVAPLAAVVLLPVACLFGIQLWARVRLAASDDAWRSDLAAERAHAASLRMPVINGAPHDCNAAERYMAVLNQIEDSPYPSGTPSGKRDKLLSDQAGLKELAKVSTANPFEPPSEKLAEILAQRRALVTALHDATRCERIDWRVPYEKGASAPVPPLLAARTLANLTVLAGHERARAGDPSGAAEYYLDVVRFGADLESQGVLIVGLIGVAVRDIGQAALGRLTVGAEPGQLPAPAIAAAFSQFDRFPASLAAAYRGERLAMTAPANTAVFAPVETLIWRPLWAHALGEMVPLLRDVEQAAGEVDLPKAVARLAPASEAAARSRNPLTALMLPSFGRAAPASMRARARAALVKAALAAEEARRSGSRYPAELSDLPTDPYAVPAKVRYRVEAGGAGYTIWSVGEDRKDDDGAGDWLQGGADAQEATDLVLARKPQA